MLITIDQIVIREMLNAVSTCVGGNGTGNFAQMVKLAVDEVGDVSVKATDGAVSIVYRGKCSGSFEAGSCLMEHKTLFGMVKRLNGDVVIKTEKNGCVVKSGRVKTVLSVRGADGFPDFPSVTGEPVTIPSETLTEIINKVKYAIAVNDPRRVINGIFIKAANENITAVALDGFKMSVHIVPIGGAAFEAIIPSRVISELSRMRGDVSLTIAGTHLRVDCGNATVYTTLIEGKYVPYEKLIPKGVTNSVTVNRAELIAAFERSLVAVDKTKPRRLHTSDAGDTLCIDATDAINTYHDEVDAETEFGGINTYFAAEQIIEALKTFGGDTVTIAQEEPTAGAVITGEHDEGHTALALPIRVKA